MPQFILDMGSPDGARSFRTLDSFTQGYVEAAFFTCTGPDNEEEGLGEESSVAEIAPSALAEIIADCCQWQTEHAALLSLAYARDYDSEQAGRDYWYTRNGHGVGFWDRKALDDDGPEYDALTAVMVANKDNPKVWGDALAQRKALSAQSLGQRLSVAAGRHEVNMYRGDDGLIYFG